MSFVLDALKVSERRRSKFARPVYAHPPRPRPRRRRRRWTAVLAAVAVLAGVFAAWRLLIPTPATNAVERPDHPGAASGPTAIAAAGTSPAAATRNDQQATAVRAGVAGENPEDGGLSANEQAPNVVPAAVAEDDPDPAAQPDKPAIDITLDTAPPDWPSLKLQMLFHSPQGERSFVQINGSSYREGERLDDGPEVVAIASDGVVLAYRGTRVRLVMQR